MTITVPRLDRSAAGERGITIADFLVPVRVSDGLGVRLRHLALILLGALLIAVAAQVRFYLPGNPVPFTGQTFAVLLAGGALGFKRGVAATTLYLLLGIVGLPVYADAKHGWEIVSGATGGYLIGFILAGALVGRLAELGWDRNLRGAVGAIELTRGPGEAPDRIDEGADRQVHSILPRLRSRLPRVLPIAFAETGGRLWKAKASISSMV